MREEKDILSRVENKASKAKVEWLKLTSKPTSKG